ncbi:glycosyltransferase family 87 protein [Hyphomicrobium sp. CS1GBMeth3]|uniref:glycosyltransferase family 87 protein n=1 Tax=Hyphomicrobium sp. CS1GBMeth3 TaxID=1892845 RepID=UPI0009313154|nr:glycosyltransferase family 87 protein [Hyphomicrobium sp. CS1GBMeth3]
MSGSLLALVLLVQLGGLLAGIALLRSPGLALRSPRTNVAVATVISAAMAAFVFAVSEPGLLFNDFRKAYYPAGQVILEQPGALAPLIDSISFVNLPIVAYLFAPFGILPFKGAAIAFLLLGFAMSLWAWKLLALEARLEHRQQWLLLFLFAANGPLLYSAKEGNTSHMVLLGLVAGLIYLRRQRDIAAGVVLGVCALIKLPLLIFGAYFVLRRNWRAVAGFSGVLALSGLLSILIFGWELNQRWFELCVLQFGSNPIGAFNVQSIPSFLIRLDAGPEVLRDWSAVEIAPLQRFVGTGLVLLMALAAIAVCARLSDAENEPRPQELVALEYALVVVLSVVSSPMSWSHYYCWLLVPIALFLSPSSAVAATPLARRVIWAAIFLISPAVVLLSFETPAIETLYVKVLLSHLLAGGLIVYGILIWALARAEPRHVHSGVARVIH